MEPRHSHLFRRYRLTGDPDAREELVRAFLPLARRLAHKYHTGSEPVEDLIQVASLALIKAVDRYDLDRGTSFVSFAVPTICGELKRHFRDRGWALHVSRGLKERALAVNQAIRSASEHASRAPTVQELCARTGLDEEQVLEALGAYNAQTTVSLDAPAREGDDDAAPLVETKLGREDAGYELVDRRLAVYPHLRALSVRERRILYMRFVEERTQADIAARIGVSQMQISRILRRTLDRVRSATNAPVGDRRLVA